MVGCGCAPQRRKTKFHVMICAQVAEWAHRQLPVHTKAHQDGSVRNEVLSKRNEESHRTDSNTNRTSQTTCNLQYKKKKNQEYEEGIKNDGQP